MSMKHLVECWHIIRTPWKLTVLLLISLGILLDEDLIKYHPYSLGPKGSTALKNNIVDLQ